MKKWIIGVCALAGLAVISSCNKKEEAPQYQCDLNGANYLNITLNGNNEKYGGNDIAGGFMRLNETAGSHDIYEVGFYKNNSFKNILIKFDTLVDIGTYTLSNMQAASITYDVDDFKAPFIDLTFNLTSFDNYLEATFSNNTQLYKYASGSFEGKYIHPTSNDTISVVGTFCSDPVAE